MLGEGVYSRAELIRRIGGAACCVVPLRDAVVAAGQNSMFEAMSLGRPLVITENVATVEYATHGENALLCPERDPKALAAAVCSVLADPRARRPWATRPGRLPGPGWTARSRYF